MPTLRADLHLHSRYSNKPTYWALRKFNCPESYTTPRGLYDIARSRGMDVMDFMERGGYTHIHASTPGSVGLLGLLIGRIMDLPVAGIYHTDIPLYVRSLTDDVLEAQASGLPVVVSDRGGPRELMVKGETGELFPCGNRSGLVEVVRHLTQDRISLALMGRSARAFALRSAPDPATTYAAILRPGTGHAQTETGPTPHEGAEEGEDVTCG